MDTNTDPIVVEETYNAPVEVVWKAITDQDQMRQWFFDTIADFDPVVGFETEFNVHSEGRDFPHQWKVVDVVPEKRIVYDWRYRGYPGASSVTWELSRSPTGTELKLTHQVQESFPQDDPVFSRESGIAGWEYLLRDSLKAFLERQDA